MRRTLLPLALLATPALAQVEQGPPNAPYEPAWENQTRAPALPATAARATPFAGPLENPWGIAQLPDGSFLVTERPGRMRLVGPDGTLSEPIAGLRRWTRATRAASSTWPSPPASPRTGRCSGPTPSPWAMA